MAALDMAEPLIYTRYHVIANNRISKMELEMSKYSDSFYPHDCSTHGYAQLDKFKFHHSQGLFVPQERKEELGLFMQAVYSAEIERELDIQARTKAGAEQQLILATPPVQLTDASNAQVTPQTNDQNHVCIEVPCVYEVDVLAQQQSAENNSKFSERDRTRAMKEVTTALLTRPMTRKVAMPKDVGEAMQKLAQIAPHIPELVEAFRIPLMEAAATGSAPLFPPILLVGGAGVGKTFAALQIATILGVTAHTLSYAASGAAGNMLSGADKNWGNSSAGLVFDTLAHGAFANPVVCLDEIDKASSIATTGGADRHPLNELLALLEPLTAKEHKDRCAEIRVDASHVIWIATANSLAGLSAPLLSRFKLILVNKPDARAAVNIALSVTQAASLQMGVSIMAPRGEVLQWLATLTPRTMRRLWTGAAGWAAAGGRQQVTMLDIEQSLGLAQATPNLRH